LTDNSLQSADKNQQEMRAAVGEKPHDVVVKFNTYRTVQRHRAVLPAIAWHLVRPRAEHWEAKTPNRKCEY